MARVFEHFVVCGIGPDLRTLDGNRGFHGTSTTYVPSLLDQYPPPSGSPYPPPPQLPTCVLPAGVEFYTQCSESVDVSTLPRSYPIVLTEGDGSKIYVSCIAFRDPVCDDIVEAYRLPEKYFADKCICLISRSPNFQVLQDALEELFVLCFSPTGSSTPLWDSIAHLVSNVLLPTPGKECILFSLGSCILSVDAPLPDGLPLADISFLPLVQCLDVDNLIRFFTAVLLERRILLRSYKYSLLTLASEAICHLIYPIRWQHVYIPMLFFSGVEYIDAPTPYMMGLHSAVDTANLTMDGVVIVDLEFNCVTSSEEIPLIPEPELGILRAEMMQLLCPSVVAIDCVKSFTYNTPGRCATANGRPWGKDRDMLLRLIFLKFFASILSGYRNFVEHDATHSFNSESFLSHRCQHTGQSPQNTLAQFLETHGFLDFLERSIHNDGCDSVLDKLQGSISRGEDPLSTVSTPSSVSDIITISGPAAVSGARYTYQGFPSCVRSEAQEEKRRQILASAVGALELSAKDAATASTPPSVLFGKGSRAEAFSPVERAAERERMVLDIKVKLQGLWLRFLKLGTDDPLSSFEYGTILALIESDAEGIGGSGFAECIQEHIRSGWNCRMTEEQFVAVRELLKSTISRATSRDDFVTIGDALEVSSVLYTEDMNGVHDYMERHLLSLPIWDELRFWDAYADRPGDSLYREGSSAPSELFTAAYHMAGLGIPDTEAWNFIETMAAKRGIEFDGVMEIRGLLSRLQQLRSCYWGTFFVKPPVLLSPFAAASSPRPVDPVSGRSWVQSMFSRDSSISLSRVRRGASSDTGSIGTKTDLVSAQKRNQTTSIRALNAHRGAISALHCVTRREVWDLIGDREDAGFFISGGTDCLVKIWDPTTAHGSELRATLKGHRGTVRAISSDRSRIASGSDDRSVIVWDKQTLQVLEELKGHEGRVGRVQVLSGDRVLTAAHDGTVKMWDLRAGSCASNVGRCGGAVLCLQYDDSGGVLAAAGRDTVAGVWDVRSGRQIHRLAGHTKWIRSMRMVEDTILTGSDDWTARVWSVSHGSCDAVLTAHSGSVSALDYSLTHREIITGSADGLLKFWERGDECVRSVKNVTVHRAGILSIVLGEQWLAVGASDNSMSLFHRPLGTLLQSPTKLGGGWQLYRKPQRTSPSLVRCMVSDLERKRTCSGGRDGILRLWEATINL